MYDGMTTISQGTCFYCTLDGRCFGRRNSKILGSFGKKRQKKNLPNNFETWIHWIIVLKHFGIMEFFFDSQHDHGALPIHESILFDKFFFFFSSLQKYVQKYFSPKSIFFHFPRFWVPISTYIEIGSRQTSIIVHSMHSYKEQCGDWTSESSWIHER